MTKAEGCRLVSLEARREGKIPIDILDMYVKGFASNIGVSNDTDDIIDKFFDFVHKKRYKRGSHFHLSREFLS